MEIKRLKDINYYWSSLNIEKSSKQFDNLKNFLPDDFQSVLDVGGGAGTLHESLKKWKKHTYILTEISNEAIFSAQKRGIKVVKLDIDDNPLPFQDNSFDLVVATDVLEHLRNPWAVLAEMARVSNKYIFIYGPNFASLKCRLDLLSGNPIRQMTADKYGSVINEDGIHTDHIYFITYKNLIHWGEKLGLKLIKSRVFWYKRFLLFRWFLEPFFKNFGDVYGVIFLKNGVLNTTDPNFKF